MSREWLEIVQLSGWFIALFAAAECLYRRLHVNGTYTRKLVHAGTGLLTLLFPLVFREVWQVATICGAFLVLLLLSRRWAFLPSINAAAPGSSGSILYPVIVVIVFAFYYSLPASRLHFRPRLFFYLPVLVMALADPVAALAGQRRQRHTDEEHPGKTAYGSLFFFLVALSTCLMLMLTMRQTAGLGRIVTEALFIAIGTTAIERFSQKGWDNFTIPLVAMGLLLLFERIR